MTRRFLLLATLGASLAGCGGGGTSEPDSVMPALGLSWDTTYVSTRASELMPSLPLPMGTQSVVITFVGASALKPGKDVVLRATRSSAPSDYLIGKEPILRKSTEVRVEAYLGPDGTGKLFCHTTSSVTPRNDGRFYGIEPRFKTLREKVTGIQLSVDNPQMIVGESQPLKITYSYPPNAEENLEPSYGDVKVDVQGIEKEGRPGGGYAILTRLDRVPGSYGTLAVTLEARELGPASITVEADGVKSNTLEIEVVAAR